MVTTGGGVVKFAPAAVVSGGGVVEAPAGVVTDGEVAFGPEVVGVGFGVVPDTGDGVIGEPETLGEMVGDVTLGAVVGGKVVGGIVVALTAAVMFTAST